MICPVTICRIILIFTLKITRASDRRCHKTKQSGPRLCLSDLKRQETTSRKYKLVLLALCAGMNLKEIQRALTISGNAVLYPKFPQDAALIVCINQNCTSAFEVMNFFAENNLDFPE